MGATGAHKLGRDGAGGIGADIAAAGLRGPAALAQNLIGAAPGRWHQAGGAAGEGWQSRCYLPGGRGRGKRQSGHCGAGLRQQGRFRRHRTAGLGAGRRVGVRSAGGGCVLGGNGCGGIACRSGDRADGRTAWKPHNGPAAIGSSEDHGGYRASRGGEYRRGAGGPLHGGGQAGGEATGATLPKHGGDALKLPGSAAGDGEAGVAIKGDVVGGIANRGEGQRLRAARFAERRQRGRQRGAGPAHRHLRSRRTGQHSAQEASQSGQPAVSHRHPILCQVLSVASQRMRMLTPDGSSDPLLQPSTEGLKL